MGGRIRFILDGKIVRLLIPGHKAVTVKQQDLHRLKEWIEKTMAPIWQPRDQELLQSWIDAITEEASDDLSDWESTFLDSIQSQLHRKGSLTEKQEARLEKLYAEKTK